MPCTFVVTGLIIGFVHLNIVLETRADCPWDDPALVKWSKPSSWPSGQLPQENEAVTIAAGKKILLDSPIPRLLTLTIEGTLVWGNVDGIRLETTYTMIYGEFYIGSEECPFEKTADIFLYGKSNTVEKLGWFGKKFLAVENGGKMEIHGEPKKSWTKLTGTVGPNRDSCGVVFDSSKEKFGQETQEGLHVVIWNPDGTLFDYGTFSTASGDQRDIDRFVVKMNNLTPELGKVLGIAVREDVGSPLASWENLYLVIERLGGKNIRKVKSFEPYALVTIVGHPDTTRESHVIRYPGNELLQASASLPLDARHLVFSAVSATVVSGSKYFTRFRVITRKLAYPLVTVLDDVSSWQAGDEIVVTSTDFDWKQYEIKTIVQCHDCARNQFRVDGEFKYSHFGYITYGVDERAEVGLLSRNIRIEGEVQKTCYYNDEREKYLCERFGIDTFGGHVKVVRGGFARVEHAELYHMGQQSVKGHYPLHFHMCDEVPGQYLKNNTIRDSFCRCITIHGTDNATVSDNVCLNHLGHGIFLEDSSERWNTIHRNLVIGTQYGTLLMSDRRPADCADPDRCNLLASYWITRPENFITDNVAAGGDGNGFVFVFADVPLGDSYQRQIDRGLFHNMSAQYTKVSLFSGNVMHSNGDNGLWFDSRISASQYHGGHYIEPDGIIKMNALYDPREPPNENGARTETVLSGLTFYRNDDFDVWMRCGNIVITNSSFADTTTSVLSAHSTGTTSCDIRHCIFIGQTENKGEPLTYINTSSVYDHLAKEDKPTHRFDRSFSDDKPDTMQSAILMYQGLVFVNNSYFNRYFNWFYNDSFLDTWGYRPVHASAAISFHRTNHYPMVPRNGVVNLKFGYCDGEKDGFRVENGNYTSPYWKILDGNELTTFHDYDGSLTGTANTQVIRDRPFYTGPECLSKPEWNMAICPYKYAQLILRGHDGVLAPKLERSWAVLVSRDDAPEDVVNMEGTNGLKYPVRVFKSYTIRFNTSLGDAPTEVEIKIKNGLEINDVIRLAICFPKSTNSFQILSTWPKINSRNLFPKWVNSLTELDEDLTMAAYYWDKENGYLFFKMSSNETFTNLDQDAAGDVIPEVTITRLDGDNQPATCNFIVPPYNNPRAPTPAPVSHAPCSGPDSPKGLGAPVIDDGARQSVQQESCGGCPVPDPVHSSRPSERRGCFLQDPDLPDFTSDLTELKKSMTPQFCIKKCFNRDFPFAGMYGGTKCQCTFVIGRNGALGIDNCNQECSGDKSQKCGGRWHEVLVLTTGAALLPAPARCGPLSRGVYYQGKCLHLNYVKEDFWSAEAMCQNQGGSLSRIDTEDKMRFIETYLSNVDDDIWFGVKGIQDKWLFLDDSPMVYGNWRHHVFEPQNKRYLYLQKYRRFKWNVSVHNNAKMSMCDLSLQTPPAPVGNCGYKRRGKLFGSNKRCFAPIVNRLTFQDAVFNCKRMFGRMSSLEELTEKLDLEAFLNTINDGERYWTDGMTTNSGFKMAFDKKISRQLMEVAQDEHLRTVCLLDTEDTDGCASGWTRNGNFCYLNTNLTVISYSQAAALCNSERTSILSIDSDQESLFIQGFAKGTLWLDLRYNGVLDNIVKSNGETAPVSFWPSPNFLQTLSEGLCVATDVASETWLHTPCSGGTGHQVVCKAPHTSFEKPQECKAANTTQENK